MALLGKLLLTTSKCYTARHIPVRNLMSKQLAYDKFGDPLTVLKIREAAVPQLKDLEVLVKMLAAPVNPDDMLTIQGMYPVKFDLPSIAGNEGVGIVEQVGKKVKGISPGNKIIVTKTVQGTWRNYATVPGRTRILPGSLSDKVRSQ